MSSMTPHERTLLQDFLLQLVQIRGVEKDPEADAMIARAVAQQPDAAYLLVQRALLLEQALNAAKAEIAQLQNRSAGDRGFLSGANAWGRDAQPRSPLSVAGTPLPPVATPGPAPGMAPQAQSPFGGFLGQAAATAAGVAGGAFLFQGLEHLFGHHDALANEDRFASQHAVSADPDPSQFDADTQDITSDIDWDDFDGGDSQV
jgi:uncharacterized protein